MKLKTVCTLLLSIVASTFILSNAFELMQIYASLLDFSRAMRFDYIAQPLMLFVLLAYHAAVTVFVFKLIRTIGNAVNQP